MNESPVYGKCTVSPDSGVALDTDFTVHCTDWREKVSHIIQSKSVGLSMNCIHKRIGKQ